MTFATTEILSPQEKQAVFNLWNQEYPKNLSHSNMEEFDNYLLGLENPYHLLVKDELHNVWGWYVDFKREQGTWFAMILDASIQGKGIGARIIKKAKNSNKILNGWVIDHAKYLKNDGSTYKSPLGFYLKNHFKVISEIRLELPKISAVKIIWTKD